MGHVEIDHRTAAIALSVTAWVLLPTHGRPALAQSGLFLVNAVEYDVVPGQVDSFLAGPLQEYKAATAGMTTKRAAKTYSSVAMNIKGM
jgi:hypothetical protein